MNRFLNIEVLHNQSDSNFKQSDLITNNNLLISPIISGIPIEDIIGDNCDYVGEGFENEDCNTKFYRDPSLDSIFLNGVVYRSEWYIEGSFNRARVLLQDLGNYSGEGAGETYWIMTTVSVDIDNGEKSGGMPSWQAQGSANVEELNWTDFTGTDIIPGKIRKGLQTQVAVGLKYENNCWQYSNGDSWVELGQTSGTSSVNGDPISFSSSDLLSGILTINHNLGQYPIGIDYTIMPKDIIFVDENTLQFDYSDQEFISGQIWFIGSTQEMLGE